MDTILTYMSVTAEFSLSTEQLSLAPTFSAAPSVELHVEQEYRMSPTAPIVFCWVRGEDLDTFEEALTNDETVTDVRLLHDSDNWRFYHMRLTGAAPVVTHDTWIELGAMRLSMCYADNRWNIRMYFPDRDALNTFHSFCNDHNLDFKLSNLYETSPKHGPPQDRLTTPQRKTLRLAHERGYFEIPRQVKLDDLATELDVSNQAVSERLRRGCVQLLKNQFG